MRKLSREEAFKRLLIIIGVNGGKLPYGAMDKLVKIYQGNVFKAMTRQNLYYRLIRRKEDTTIDNLAGKNPLVETLLQCFWTCQERLFTIIPTMQPKQVIEVILAAGKRGEQMRKKRQCVSTVCVIPQ
jgi:hypothetical protein